LLLVEALAVADQAEGVVRVVLEPHLGLLYPLDHLLP
jgi:hypothetical protein